MAMAESLGLEVVAEGVETLEQLDFLRKLGCGQVQGYYYSRPVWPADLVEWLRLRLATANRVAEDCLPIPVDDES